VDEKLAANLGYREGGGALISEVEAKSPAAIAGIQPGMLITAVGRYEITGARQVEKLLRQIDTGSRVDFGLAWWQPAARGRRLVGDTFQLVAR
jgi:S1-C subfamily serine protease